MEMETKIKPDWWVARDKDCVLAAHPTKPIRYKYKMWTAFIEDILKEKKSGQHTYHLPKDHPTGEGLTWEDEPVPVVLVPLDVYEKLMEIAATESIRRGQFTEVPIKVGPDNPDCPF